MEKGGLPAGGRVSVVNGDWGLGKREIDLWLFEPKEDEDETQKLTSGEELDDSTW